ncbi:MAG TPA: LEA type 2 family protein [Rhodanobacteraceae bacterium]|nr:LEA type 2 family protein [Rhodanobacteraceae bacterium]
MKRLPFALLMMAAVLLAGCGPTHHVFPPDLSVQQLHVDSDGHWQLTLRLRNYSYDASVHWDHVQVDLTVGAAGAGTIDAGPDIDIAEQSADVVHTTLDPPAAARQALAVTNQPGTTTHSIAYTLKGTLEVTGEGGGRQSFPVDRQGWLSPVPGLSGTWR